MKLLTVVAGVLLVSTGVADGQNPSPASGRAAISGHVVDEFGDPVIRARVFVEVRTGPNETRAVATTEADDRGDYRIGRLPAGSYLLSVVRIDDAFLITPTAVFTSSPRQVPRRVYYGGAHDASEAETLPIGADEERDRTDFVLSVAPLVLPPVIAMRVQQAAAAGVVARPPSGSATLRGHVVTADRHGLPYAHLLLIPPDDLQTRVAVADRDGRFEFSEVATGRVRVLASKAGHDPVAAERSVEVVANHTPADIELTLARWSTLSGQVADDRNEPIVGATVQTLHVRYEGGRRRLVPAGMQQLTNDLGHYHL